MATYLIKSEKSITRQEGDTADIVFVIPDIFDLSLYKFDFRVYDANNRTLISKNTVAAGIIKNQQTITIPLLVTDTKGKSGKHGWELEISNDMPEVITIGKGPFIILSERIK